MGKPENPSAFPFPDARDSFGCGIREGSGGMTLRDWFAGQALAGDLAAQNEMTGEWGNDASEHHILERARFFFRFADAMLVARALPNPDTEGQDK